MNLILDALTELETKHGFRILYACESGSRAWGFASADSDYDVRFVYVWPKTRYLGIFEPQNTVDCPIGEDNLDITGWDLRKALPLFRKANGSLMEWLFSPIPYREDPEFMGAWRNLVPSYFLPKNSAAHYMGLSRQIWGGMTKPGASLTAKQYLYVLRSLLACRSVVEKRERIPVPFEELRNGLDLSPEIAAEIERMIAEKSSGKESDGIERNALLDAFIEAEQARLDPLIGELPSELGPVEALDTLFQSVLSD